MNRKHLGWRTLWRASGVFAGLALRGQTNFLRSMFHFGSVYYAAALLADHARLVAYDLPVPPPAQAKPERAALYIHTEKPRVRAAAG